MLKTPKNKRELIKLLQDGENFTVVTVEYGKSKDVADRVRKLHSMKQLAVIVIELR